MQDPTISNRILKDPDRIVQDPRQDPTGDKPYIKAVKHDIFVRYNNTINTINYQFF